MSFASSLCALLSFAGVSAVTHNFDWKLGWKTVNPDGMKEREIVAINDEWPLPIVRVNMGDRIIINVTNKLDDPARNSSIHFHGLFQNGTNDMDGPPMLTQCPSSPSSSFVYNFTIDQPGTYWYHAHVENLYPDGYRQLLLIDNDDAWFANEVYQDIPLTLSDWYHELTQDLSDEQFMTSSNPSGAEPVPNSLIMNETIAPKLQVEPNRTYRLRIANIGAFTGFFFYMPDVTFTIVEVDGVYTEPADAEMIYISAAQRYSLLFNTSDDPSKIYPMVQIADMSMYDEVPSDLQLNHTGFLYTGIQSDDKFVQVDNDYIFNTAPIGNGTGIAQSDDSDSDDEDFSSAFTSNDLVWFDDMDLVPYDREPLLEPVNVNYTLNLTMGPLDDGKPYAFFNDITWTMAKVPTLFSVLSAPSDEVADNSTIYGTDTHPIVLRHMDVVQIILNNNDSGRHPFHLHGHNFQAVLRAPGQDDDTYVPYDSTQDDGNYPKIPMKRDTLVVLPNSHFLIRFRADNPGVWFFHCHIDWHLTQGLALEFIEAPAQIRQNYKVHPLSKTHNTTCERVGVPLKGNAAANTVDFLNLTGQNTQQNFPPSS